MPSDFERGDRVSWDGRHGYKEGEIGNLRFKQPRRRDGYWVAEIPLEDGVYSIPTRMLTLISKAGAPDENGPSPSTVLQEFKNKKREDEYNRREKQRLVREEKGTGNLLQGGPIEVQVRTLGGFTQWRKEQFERYAPSGRIGYWGVGPRNRRKMNWAWPKFVRVPVSGVE